MSHPAPDAPPTFATLAGVFLKISLLGFGGPNAHLALMLDEVVERRGWVDREHFLQLVGVTNLLPGPNSSEVAIHLGYTQRGWPGALTTGLAFLGPTFLLVLLSSALYFRFGTLPAVEPLFWGLQPVIVAVILHAGWRLAVGSVRGTLLLGLGLAGGLVGLVAGRWVVAAMALGGLFTWMRWRWDGRPIRGGASGQGAEEEGPRSGGSTRRPEARRGGADPPPSPRRPSRGDDDGEPGLRSGLLLAPLAVGSLGSLAGVFWTHLWMGAVLFGGGYVLVVLLEPYAVGTYGWLTASQFLDGVALTQAVPGPISTLAAFVGYAAAGVPGAVAGTLGIYLPAFAAVLLVAPHLERLRRVEPVRATLEGVSAVAAGSILGVGVSLAFEAVPDLLAGGILAVALVALVRLGLQPLWLILAGLAAGAARMLVAA